MVVPYSSKVAPYYKYDATISLVRCHLTKFILDLNKTKPYKNKLIQGFTKIKRRLSAYKFLIYYLNDRM